MRQAAQKENIMKAIIRYFSVVDVEPLNENMSFNVGDYRYGRTIAVNVSDKKNPVALAVRYWTSSEFDFCNLCGTFRTDEHYHSPKDRVKPSEAEGWERGVGSPFNGDDWKNEKLFVKVGV